MDFREVDAFVAQYAPECYLEFVALRQCVTARRVVKTSLYLRVWEILCTAEMRHKDSLFANVFNSKILKYKEEWYTQSILLGTKKYMRYGRTFLPTKGDF